MIHVTFPNRKLLEWADRLRENEYVEFDAKHEPVVRVFSHDWTLQWTLPIDVLVLEKGRITIEGASFRKKMHHIKKQGGVIELFGTTLTQDQKSHELEKSSKKPLAFDPIATHHASSRTVWEQAFSCLGLYRPLSNWHPFRTCIQLHASDQTLRLWHTDGYGVHEASVNMPNTNPMQKTIPLGTWDAFIRWFEVSAVWSIGLQDDQLTFQSSDWRLSVRLMSEHIHDPIVLNPSFGASFTWDPVETFVAAPTKKEPDRKKSQWIRAESEWIHALRAYRDEQGCTYDDLWIRFRLESNRWMLEASQNGSHWHVIYDQPSLYDQTWHSVSFRGHALLKGLHAFPGVQQANFSDLGLEVIHMQVDPMVVTKSLWMGCEC